MQRQVQDRELSVLRIQAADVFRTGQGEPDDAGLIHTNGVRIDGAGFLVDQVRGFPGSGFRIENTDAARTGIGDVVLTVLPHGQRMRAVPGTRIELADHRIFLAETGPVVHGFAAGLGHIFGLAGAWVSNGHMVHRLIHGVEQAVVRIEDGIVRYPGAIEAVFVKLGIGEAWIDRKLGPHRQRLAVEALREQH